MNRLQYFSIIVMFLCSGVLTLTNGIWFMAMLSGSSMVNSLPLFKCTVLVSTTLIFSVIGIIHQDLIKYFKSI